MAFSKKDKALLHAKYGDQVYAAMIEAENVIVTESGGGEVSLADKLTEILGSVGGVSGKVATLMGGDSGKSVRAIAGEVLTAAGQLSYKKVGSVGEINTSAPDADKYIYLVPKSAKTNDKYDEYMVLDGEVEKVGDWEVNLAGYLQKVTNATAGHIAVFTEGGGIEDSGKTVSDLNTYTEDEKAKVAASKAVTDKLSDNADVLKGIDSAAVAAWNAAGRVYASQETPTDWKNGDLWLQTFPAE